ncbi:procathepsin L-like [Pollicipes pollicipes]|uniref:procathepsin L-like n=1 Tax=Pollicipes pollicipes TaxID=41117 RepID=UPI001884A638|nr:procathepsin L-like [Pollicipes pollicipes]
MHFFHAVDTRSFFGTSHVTAALQEARSTTSVGLRFRTGRGDALLLQPRTNPRTFPFRRPRTNPRTFPFKQPRTNPRTFPFRRPPLQSHNAAHSLAMQLAVLFALIAAAAGSLVARHEWESFKLTHRKQYETLEQEAHRMGVFADNMRRIREHNAAAAAGRHSFTLAMNHFGDLSEGEFKAYVAKFNTSRRGRAAPRRLHQVSAARLPEAKDWRDEGAVTPVKDQGQCGSCWAFSTTGSVEGATFLSSGALVSLSEQNLMDCSRPQGNLGCQGGLMDSAFDYVIANGGVATEDSYPYEERSSFRCRYDAAAPGASISSYKDVPSGSEEALQSAVAFVGPVSVAIDASRFSFQFYSSGVYDEAACSSSRLDHGVLAVGYGSEAGADYWLVKNSWGTSWGQAGYIWMARNRRNQCGVATQASYPVV